MLHHESIDFLFLLEEFGGEGRSSTADRIKVVFAADNSRMDADVSDVVTN
jgi:hypothetical protein